MNKIKSILSILFAALFLYGCSDEDKEPTLSDIIGSSLNDLASNDISIRASDANRNPLLCTFTWTETKFFFNNSEYRSAAGPIVYALEMDLYGNDFANAYTLASTSELHADILIENMISVLKSEYGMAEGDKNSFEFRLLTTYGSNETIYSNNSLQVSLEINVGGDDEEPETTGFEYDGETYIYFDYGACDWFANGEAVPCINMGGKAATDAAEMVDMELVEGTLYRYLPSAGKYAYATFARHCTDGTWNFYAAELGEFKSTYVAKSDWSNGGTWDGWFDFDGTTYVYFDFATAEWFGNDSAIPCCVFDITSTTAEADKSVMVDMELVETGIFRVLVPEGSHHCMVAARNCGENGIWNFAELAFEENKNYFTASLGWTNDTPCGIWSIYGE